MSCRHFVYGPGDGGLTTEYLHVNAGAPKLLLTRQGETNPHESLRDRPSGVGRARATTDEKTATTSCAGQPVEGGAERETARRRSSCARRTSPSRCGSCAASRTRAVRGLRADGDASVIDRRGLVAEGQIAAEKVDEKTRYGGLLFGETIQEYAGWDEKQAKDKA